MFVRFWTTVIKRPLKSDSFIVSAGWTSDSSAISM